MDSMQRLGGQLGWSCVLLATLVACDGPRRSSELAGSDEQRVEQLRGFLEHDRLAQADSLLRAVGSLEERSPELQYWSAQLSARLGDRESAEEALVAAAGSTDEIAHEAQFELSLLQSARGDHQAALESSRIVLSAHPDHEAARAMAASSAIELGRTEEARRDAELLPEAPLRWTLLGQIDLIEGKLEEALPLLERAWRADPERASSRYLLAQLHVQRGDTTALALLRPLAAADPPYADSAQLLDSALEAAGRPAEAKRVREALRLKRLRAQRQKTRAEAVQLAESGQLEEALQMLEDAVERAPEDAQLRNDLAAVLTRMKRYPEAEEQFLRAISLAPADAAIHGNLAQLYVLMGEEEKARAAAALFQQLSN